MDTTPGIENLKKKAAPILQRNDVAFAGVFGSYARGEATEESDIDILVELPEGKSLLDLVALQNELEEVLRIRVDVLTRNSLSPHLKPIIERELIPIL